VLCRRTGADRGLAEAADGRRQVRPVGARESNSLERDVETSSNVSPSALTVAHA
jgi:hypothetical protein